jgi:hypothetical protein
VLYLIPSPIFRDVWRVYSKTAQSKGMMAHRGGWVIGAWGLGGEFDAVFLPEIAEPTELSCCTL